MAGSSLLPCRLCPLLETLVNTTQHNPDLICSVDIVVTQFNRAHQNMQEIIPKDLVQLM